MKQPYAFFAFVACLLGGLLTSGTASAQGCSGQFIIASPSFATLTYNNGTSTTDVPICPDGSGRLNFTVDEKSKGGNFNVTNLDGVTVFTKDFGLVNGDNVFSVSLPASGNTSYTFNNTLTCTNDKNATINFTVRPSVTLNSNAGSSGVCAGSTVRLTATGGAATNPSYTFFANGTQIGQPNSTGILDVTPQASTNYTVKTASAGCNGNIATQAVTVNTTSNLSISSNATNNTTPTAGTPVTLTSTGGTDGSYIYTAFTNGVTTTVSGNGPSVTVRPTTTTRYTVNVGGCANPASVLIQVGNTPLPVGLTSFTATQTSRGVELRWTTAFELNNSHFQVERSLDGAEFRAVGRVAGAGTTSGATTSYHFTDPTSVVAGPLYYRLRQVDFSGDDVLSGVRVVAVSKGAHALGATVAPNPATDYATVRFTAVVDGRAMLEVRNVLGQQVLVKTVVAQPGVVEIPLPEAAAWRTGVYYLIISQNQQRQVIRLNRR